MAGLAAAALLAVAGCGGSVDGGTVAASSNEDSAVCDGDIPADSAIDVWYHQGEEADSIVVKDQVKAFNESQDDVTVTLKQIPVTDYANTIAGAAAADDLPAVLDTDASYAFNYAWSGDLVPLDDCIPDELREDLLPSAISGGTYAGKLWAIPMVDSGVGMWANKSALEGAGIRIPASADEAWTAEEFDEVLAKLKAAGFERPLDMKKNYGKSEWYAYGFAPILWSGGGDLIDRETYEKADGVINSPESVKAMEHFKSYFADGLVDDNTDDAAFVEAGRRCRGSATGCTSRTRRRSVTTWCSFRCRTTARAAARRRAAGSGPSPRRPATRTPPGSGSSTRCSRRT
jgi:multiple sugar transport system substrate-binding protein